MADPSPIRPAGSHAAREEWWGARFHDPALEWRRLFAETIGTLLLVLAGAGSAVVSAATHVEIGRTAAVTAPGLTVLAMILTLGAVSGAHLNPAVSMAFAFLRGEHSQAKKNFWCDFDNAAPDSSAAASEADSPRGTMPVV